MKPKQNTTDLSKRKAPRTHRQVITLNDQELRALERYCQKYHVTNKAKFIRETLMRTILKRFEEDHPTLF
ncbi:MAG: hypothetical protein J6U94_01995 [Paludibacteraceae bacterium]|nr:hypothetical protein [Paludibacteraceae bacterium]MBO7258821.1 hypothetical protein [Paludibacteraceae bacterium]